MTLDEILEDVRFLEDAENTEKLIAALKKCREQRNSEIRTIGNGIEIKEEYDQELADILQGRS